MESQIKNQKSKDEIYEVTFLTSIEFWALLLNYDALAQSSVDLVFLLREDPYFHLRSSSSASDQVLVDCGAASLRSVLPYSLVQGPRGGTDVVAAARCARYSVDAVLPEAQCLIPCRTGGPDALPRLRLPWANDVQERVGFSVNAYVDAFLLEGLPDPSFSLVSHVWEVDVVHRIPLRLIRSPSAACAIKAQYK